MKKVKIILDIASIILSIITIGYCIATWRRDDAAEVIDAEIVE
jgi:hypothetical protein